jgi:hypothetical protein
MTTEIRIRVESLKKEDLAKVARQVAFAIECDEREGREEGPPAYEWALASPGDPVDPGKSG